MGRISRAEDNLFPKPHGAFVRNIKYVYVNTTNKYVPPAEKKRKKGTRGYTGHDSVCIGVLQDPAKPKDSKMYANARYREIFLEVELPDPPRFSDSLSVGLYSWMAEASEQSGLTAELKKVFQEEDTRLILDLSAYMLSRESAVMQHYPAWAREHVLFSDDIRNDTYIGNFLKKNLSIPKIRQFRENWAVRNIGDGRVYLCYDSTNVNSQAEGVFIVQKGHAKDDPSRYQVNTDYVIRQTDGLPLTYLHSPGSVTDIAQAQEMIKFMHKMHELSGKDVDLCLICDRGYISGKNLRHMDQSKIDYILMLRTNFNIYEELSDAVIDGIKTYKNALETADGSEQYGVTRSCTLYEDGPECYAQIIWSHERYESNRSIVTETISEGRKKLKEFIAANDGKSMLLEELKWVPEYFKLQTIKGEPRFEERKKRGRGHGTKVVEIPTVKVIGYDDDEDEINRMYQKGGIMILITSEKLTAQSAIEAYAKRDSVEKVFQALKSHLGMDKIGVTTEEAMHGKGLLWFVASILHAVLFNKTATLRLADKKRYTVPAMIDQLEAIKADIDLSTSHRQRRYKLTQRQQKILHQWGVTESNIDEFIAGMRE